MPELHSQQLKNIITGVNRDGPGEKWLLLRSLAVSLSAACFVCAFGEDSHFYLLMACFAILFWHSWSLEDESDLGDQNFSAGEVDMFVFKGKQVTEVMTCLHLVP